MDDIDLLMKQIFEQKEKINLLREALSKIQLMAHAADNGSPASIDAVIVRICERALHGTD